jgi:hypothetical protein
MNQTHRPLCTNECGRTCSSIRRKFCSQRCHFEYDFKLRMRLFEAELYPPTSQARMAKKYLIRRFGEHCSRCGWAERNPVSGKIPVEVEHLDGDWMNNRPSNVCLLCPNCHSLTATYRGLNRGRGRATRLGGRSNPLRGSLPARTRLVEPQTPFPLPRKLAALVEGKEPSQDRAGVAQRRQQ